MAKLHTVVMRMLGVAVLSAVAAASAVAPRGNLEVAQLSLSGLHAKFKSGNAHVHAITTNSSIRVHSVEPAPVGSAAFVVGSERKIVHGKATGTHTAAVTQLLDKVFLSLHSKNERTVMLEVPEEAASYDPQYIDDMYLESPRIVSGVEAALRTYEATMEEIFTRHTDSLTAFVDMSWQAGQDHGVTGKAFPHTLALHLLALETSKSLDDWVPPPPVEHASTSRRVLQAPSNCEEKGFFECGGVFSESLHFYHFCAWRNAPVLCVAQLAFSRSVARRADYRWRDLLLPRRACGIQLRLQLCWCRRFGRVRPMLAELLPRPGHVQRDVWTNLPLLLVDLRRLLSLPGLLRPRQVLRSNGLRSSSVLGAFSATVVSQHTIMHSHHHVCRVVRAERALGLLRRRQQIFLLLPIPWVQRRVRWALA